MRYLPIKSIKMKEYKIIFKKIFIITFLIGGILVTFIYLHNVSNTDEETRFSQEEIVKQIDDLYKERLREWEDLEKTWIDYKKQSPDDEIKFKIFIKKTTRILNRIKELDSEIKNLENRVRADLN